MLTDLAGRRERQDRSFRVGLGGPALVDLQVLEPERRARADDHARVPGQRAGALVELQVELGRQYLVRQDAANAITHLRLALQTADYPTDDELAALADFYLARALQQKGYDRAALDQYDRFLRRLQRPTMAMRSSPELAYLANRPDVLYADVAFHQDHMFFAVERAGSISLVAFNHATTTPAFVRQISLGSDPRDKTYREDVFLVQLQ